MYRDSSAGWEVYLQIEQRFLETGHGGDGGVGVKVGGGYGSLLINLLLTVCQKLPVCKEQEVEASMYGGCDIVKLVPRI